MEEKKLPLPLENEKSITTTSSRFSKFKLILIIFGIAILGVVLGWLLYPLMIRNKNHTILKNIGDTKNHDPNDFHNNGPFDGITPETDYINWPPSFDTSVPVKILPLKDTPNYDGIANNKGNDHFMKMIDNKLELTQKSSTIPVDCQLETRVQLDSARSIQVFKKINDGSLRISVLDIESNTATESFELGSTGSVSGMKMLNSRVVVVSLSEGKTLTVNLNSRKITQFNRQSHAIYQNKENRFISLERNSQTKRVLAQEFDETNPLNPPKDIHLSFSVEQNTIVVEPSASNPEASTMTMQRFQNGQDQIVTQPLNKNFQPESNIVKQHNLQANITNFSVEDISTNPQDGALIIMNSNGISATQVTANKDNLGLKSHIFFRSFPPSDNLFKIIKNQKIPQKFAAVAKTGYQIFKFNQIWVQQEDFFFPETGREEISDIFTFRKPPTSKKFKFAVADQTENVTVTFDEEHGKIFLETTGAIKLKVNATGYADEAEASATITIEVRDSRVPIWVPVLSILGVGIATTLGLICLVAGGCTLYRCCRNNSNVNSIDSEENIHLLSLSLEDSGNETIDLKKYLIDQNEITYGKKKLLGEGTYAKVYEITYKNKKAVIKEPVSSEKNNGKHEFETMLRIPCHKNIIKIFGARFNEKTQCYDIVMEQVEHSLKSFLQECLDSKTLSWEMIYFLFVYLLDGLMHIHEQGFVHRDLKPENILVKPKKNAPIPLFIDFGSAQKNGAEVESSGTPLYMKYFDKESSKRKCDFDDDTHSLMLIYVAIIQSKLHGAFTEPFSGVEAHNLATEKEKGIDLTEWKCPTTFKKIIQQGFVGKMSLKQMSEELNKDKKNICDYNPNKFKTF